MNDIGLVFVAVLAVILPFEFKRPLFTIGPVAITNTEIVIYSVIGIWGIGLLLGRRRKWSSVHTTVTIWAAVVMLAAILAPSYKAESLKFALRSLGGCMICFAAADFIRTTRSAAVVAVALLAGSCLSALSALAEVWLPGAAVILMRFKTQPSWNGSYLRASGTFQYANIASMYWESTLAMALSIPAWWRRRQVAKAWSWAGFACILVLIEAILLGASRAGVVVAFLIPAGLFCLVRDSAISLRKPAGTALLSLCALLALQASTDPLLSLRLTTRNTSSWYRADYGNFPAQASLKVGELSRIPVTIRNMGKVTWRMRGKQSTALSYHWLDPTGKTVLIWQGARSELPADLQPGGRVSLDAWIIPPGKPGSYILQWDMLQEDVAWFSVFGPSEARVKIEVLPSGTAVAGQDLSAPVALPLPVPPARMDLWRAAVRMWLQRPMVGVGPDNFRHLYGSYLGQKVFDDRVHANNFYIEVLVTTGVMGMLALVAVLGAVAVSLRRAWLQALHPEEKLLVLGLAAALAAFCLHGLADYFLPFTPTYGLFWLLAGMAAGLGNGRGRQ